MLQLIDFIKSNSDWEQKLQEKPYCLTIKRKDNFVIFNYNQIESDFSYKLVRESRGIIIDENELKIVCYPFDKFFNHAETYADKIDWSTARVQEKLDGCFEKSQRIMLADGTVETIGNIVNKKLSCDVLTYNFKTGKCEPKKVIGWKRSKSYYPDKEWITINLNGICSNLDRKISQHNNMIVTRNHMIYYYENGVIKEKRAEKIKQGDLVLIPKKELTQIEKQVIYGTLLGDGSFNNYNNKKGKHKLSIYHSNKQKDYAIFKIGLIPNLKWRVRQVNYRNSYNGEKILCDSYFDFALSDIYDIVVKNKKKTITKEWLEKLDWLGLAIWYMDDGSLNKSCKNNSVYLHTEGFSKNENKIIQDFFKTRGMKTYLRYYKNYYVINLSTKASEYFFKKIRQYVPECMQYKLPERHRGFYKDIINTENIVYTLTPMKVKGIKNGWDKSKFDNGKWFYKYDIEVADNHNYFCDGILVHNSIMKLWHYNNKWNISTNGMIDAREANLSININKKYKTFYDLFMQAVDNTKLNFDTLNKNYTYMFELVSPFNKIVVPYTETKIIHIGTRDNQTLKEININIGIEKPKEYSFKSIKECIKVASKLPFNEEGYIVVDGNWNRVKIKSPAYVAVHHLKNNGIVTKSRILELIMKNEHEEFLNYYPEFKEIFNEINIKLNDFIFNMDQCIEIASKNIRLDNRKIFAEFAKTTKCPPLMFNWLDKKINNTKEWLNTQRIEKILEWIGV